jgi:ribulose-phosphate 3-epimerase
MMRIWPSILAADILNIQNQIECLIAYGIHQIHLDIMDNHYVPNLSFSADLCKAITKKFPELKIDVHLMTKPVDNLILSFAQAGAHRISIHADATQHLNYSLNLIKQEGLQAGLAINPGEDITHIDWCHHQLDYILMMTVNPGFGGQTLLPHVVDKVTRVHHLFPDLPLMVDGGINLDNIQTLNLAGAKQFVIGSSLFKSENFPHSICDFLQAIQHS